MYPAEKSFQVFRNTESVGSAFNGYTLADWQKMVGQTLLEPGFSSTAVGKSVFSGRKFHLEIEVPKGIDPGWGYSVGEANQGKRVAEQVMDAWRKDGSKWESLTPNETPPPGPLPVDAPQSQLGATVEDVGALSSLIKRAIGGTEAAIPAPMGDTVLVNAPALADQWAGHLSRSAIAPIVKEAITDPAEIWMSFERHPETGKVVMRQRALKRLALFSRHPGVPVMIQSSAGRLEDFRVLDSDPAAIDRFRVGRLIWKRTEIRS